MNLEKDYNTSGKIDWTENAEIESQEVSDDLGLFAVHYNIRNLQTRREGSATLWLRNLKDNGDNYFPKDDIGKILEKEYQLDDDDLTAYFFFFYPHHFQDREKYEGKGLGTYVRKHILEHVKGLGAKAAVSEPSSKSYEAMKKISEKLGFHQHGSYFVKEL